MEWIYVMLYSSKFSSKSLYIFQIHKKSIIKYQNYIFHHQWMLIDFKPQSILNRSFNWKCLILFFSKWNKVPISLSSFISLCLNWNTNIIGKTKWVDIKYIIPVPFSLNTFGLRKWFYFILTFGSKMNLLEVAKC